jgi:hypothetical protein
VVGEVALINKTEEVPAVAVVINTWVRVEVTTVTIRETKGKEIVTKSMEIIHKKAIVRVGVQWAGMDRVANNSR